MTEHLFLFVFAANTDFTFDSSLVISVGPVNDSNCIVVQVVDDAVYEGDQIFAIKILDTSPPLPCVGGEDEVNFTIQDPEGLS